MESVPQPVPKKGLSILGALGGMAITFVLGIYVGLHPSWIPIKGAGSSEVGPTQLPGSTLRTPDHAAPVSTQPATQGT